MTSRQTEGVIGVGSSAALGGDLVNLPEAPSANGHSEDKKGNAGQRHHHHMPGEHGEIIAVEPRNDTQSSVSSQRDRKP
jgi:hypothetical protein